MQADATYPDTSCMQALRVLEDHIQRASSPYAASKHGEEARRLAEEIARECPTRFGRLAQLLFERYSGHISTSDFVAGLDVPELLGDESDQLALKVLNYCARYSFHDPSDTGGTNARYRERCLRLAQDIGGVYSQLVILTNWAYAAIADQDLTNAEEWLARAGVLIEDPTITGSQEPKVAETLARNLSHHAKLKLVKASKAAVEPATALIQEAVMSYKAAITRIEEHDHLRVNMQIEAAAWLADLGLARGELQTLVEGKAFLGLALRALDAHVCNDCRAYYHSAAASTQELEAALVHPFALSAAVAHLQKAVTERQAGVTAYRAHKHHLVTEAERELDATRRWLEKMMKPKNIFLSHRSADKEQVRIFADALRTLGFDPWLDEDMIVPGQPLERALHAGMSASCAAVFFVTPNFVDEGYLRTEIDYAFQRRREVEASGGVFPIFALVLEEEKDSTPVPSILGPYVHGSYRSSLAAFAALMRALPVRAGTVLWRDADPSKPA